MAVNIVVAVVGGLSGLEAVEMVRDDSCSGVVASVVFNHHLSFDLLSSWHFV